MPKIDNLFAASANKKLINTQEEANSMNNDNTNNNKFLHKGMNYLKQFTDILLSNYLAPNFVLAHYIYFLSVIFLTSILAYFIGNSNNVAYVDILFFGFSACTQAGLVTVTVSKLTLSQQIFLYFACMFSTPIFVHGSMLFIRLFWYEKHFTNINKKSVQQYQLRRANTIAQLRADLTSTTNIKSYDPHNASKQLSERIKDFNDINIDNNNNNNNNNNTNLQDVKFGDLPKPRDLINQKNNSKNINHDSTNNNLDYIDYDEADENYNDDDDDEDLVESIQSANDNKDIKIPGRFKLSKRKRTLKNKKRLNQSINNSYNSSIDKSPNKVYNESDNNENTTNSLLIDDDDDSSVIPLKKSHTIQTISAAVQNVIPRSLTALSRQRTNVNVSKLNDEELYDYAARQLGERPTWGSTSRNANVIALTKEQKEELGGAEYQATKLLTKIVYGYYFGIIIIVSCVLLLPFIMAKKHYQNLLIEDGATRPAWWVFFTVMSGFANEGLTTNNSSMVIFDQNLYVLIIFALLMLAGNTATPINLRAIVWIIRFFTKPSTMRYESLTFLLDHPRRCFTLLFPANATLWLLVVLLVFNFTDWILFIILDLGRASLAYLPKGYRVFDGLFQAVCTRTTGFNVFSLTSLNQAIQLSYVIMMYISVYPLAISIRATNVYEDQSLGVYNAEEELGSYTKPKIQYVTGHIRKQLSYDLWFLALMIFLICISEHNRLDANDINFSVFSIIFEAVSAYGTVGLSLGYPTSNASFCGQFNTVSKLLVMLIMLRGRHRGLPSAIDRSIMLPGDKVDARDDIENAISIRRGDTNIILHDEDGKE